MGFSSLFLWALILASSSLLLCIADPTDGFTAVQLTDSNLVLQKPYDIPLDQRYSYVNGVRRLWVYDTDKSFQIGSPTKPRTEIRIIGYDYSSGVWQFEGYVFVPEGTTGTNIVQIHRRDHDIPATTFMMGVYNGQFRDYGVNFVASNVYNKWMRINVIHNVNNNKVTVFINGVQKLEMPGNGVSSFYFKCGVYTQHNPSHYMESQWKDIRILEKNM